MRNIGDIVAIHIDGRPSVYARIEDYEPDVKPRWFKVRMLFLTFPPQDVTWILREAQVDGEPFTMNNVPVKLEIVERLGEYPGMPEAKSEPPKNPGGKVINLADRARLLKDEK